MAEEFDPYYKWLAIPAEEQPPHHYRLLALRPFESDGDVIASAADQRMAHLRTFQSGKNSVQSQKLLNEIAAARVCLLNPARKAAYDKQLRLQLQSAKSSATPPPISPPPVAGAMLDAVRAADRPAMLAVETPFDDLSGAATTVRSTRRTARKKSHWAATAVPLLVIGLAAVIGAVVFLKAPPEPIKKPLATHSSTAAHEPAPVEPKGPAKEAAGGGNSAVKRPEEPKHHAAAENEPAPQPKTAPNPAPAGKEWLSAPTKRLIAHLAAKANQHRFQKSDLIGGSGGTAFQEIPPDGALLIGLLVSPDNFAGHPVLRGAQGIYLTRKGILQGERFGNFGDDAIQLMAKPGYAVGSLQANVGARVDGLKVEFQRILAEGLDSSDAYSSEWVGGRGGGSSPGIVSDGRAAVGIFGGVGAELDSIGLLLDEEPTLPSSASMADIADRPEMPDEESPFMEPQAVRSFKPRKLKLPKKERLPPPTAEAQKEALALIHDLFKQDYADASKGSKQKFALAEKLYRKAEETNDDPTARFVLISEARDLAAKAGDSQAAGDSIVMLANYYDIDDVGMTLAAFEKAAEVSTAPLPLRQRLVLNCLTLVDLAVDQDKHAVGEQLLAIGRKASGKAQDSILAARLGWRANRLREQKAAYDQVHDQIEKLKSDSSDADANLAVGRYRALYQDNWRDGLPLLAKGSDAALKNAAELELAAPTEPDAQMELGDAWEKIAKSDEKHRAEYERRAKFWYEKAVNLLKGLNQAKVEKKLDDLRGGRGLKVEYFRDEKLTPAAKAVTRIEPSINAQYGRTSPVPDLPADRFSVRWSGQITAPAKGDYQLTLDHDDGGRLWIDGKLVIDEWNDVGNGQAFVALSPKPRSIKVELCDNRADAHCVLKWSQKGGFSQQVVPPEAFWQDKATGSKTFAPLPNPPYRGASMLGVAVGAGENDSDSE